MMLTGPEPVTAQTLATGIISGIVVDEAGRPLNGVVITISRQENRQRLLVRSDRSGVYTSDLLAPGWYDALFERLGFAPLLVEGILVSPGTSRQLRARLESTSGPVESRRITAPSAMLSMSGPSGPDRWLISEGGVPRMPYDGHGLDALLGIASMTGQRFEMEGLPATLTSIVVDGIPLARRAGGFDVFGRTTGLPLMYFTQVGVATDGADVEYRGSASGHLSAHTRSGGRVRTVYAHGDFGNSGMVPGAQDRDSFTSYRAGTLVGGSIIGDTASFVVGGEVLRSRVPFDAFWPGNAEITRLTDAADSQYGVDLARYTGPALATVDRESAFGRFDMRLSDVTTLSVRGLVANIPQPEPIAPWTESRVGSTITPTVREVLASATVNSVAQSGLISQLDAGFELSQAQERPVSERGPALPRTLITAAGQEFGSDTDPDYRSELMHFYARGMLHFRSGSHWRKIGASVSFPRYTVPGEVGRAGSFTFADADDFADGLGGYRGIEGPGSQSEFSTRQISILAQDTWRPSPTVELMVGLRLTSSRLPDSSEIRNATRWRRLSGQINRVMPGRLVDVEPRFLMTLNPFGRDEWRLRAGVTVDADMADPGAIAEVISNDGTLEVRSGFGQLDVWPRIPTDPVAPTVGATLTVIGPEFRGPRTARAFGSLTRALGANGAVSVNVMYRKTQFLAQRVELNVTPTPTGFDQFGRPLWGELEKRQGILTASSGSNRRFEEFEAVWGLQATGESTYTGVTVTAERSLAGPFAFFGSYTYAKTEDDWLLGTAGDPFSQIAPVLDTAADVGWSKGRSDLDVPHRAVAGAELVLPMALSPTIAAVYRYQSGYPFTPGFRPGVDANGDGSASNDPAYIDDRITGMSELLSDWPCLRDDAGGFARRNGCRGPDVQSLDARFALTLHRESGFTASFVLDALNLITSQAGVADRAVYLVDPARPLGSSAGGVTTVPLIANPDFGQILTRFSPQRQLRLGVRMRF